LVALYADAIANCAFRFEGTLCADTGDAIAAVFGTPEKQADPNGNAARAAEAIRTALTELNSGRTARGEVVCAFGIAINCGELVHGFTGSADRLQFKVIGRALREARAQSESHTEINVAELPQRFPDLKAA
jgi:adenylate cyclase